MKLEDYLYDFIDGGEGSYLPRELAMSYIGFMNDLKKFRVELRGKNDAPLSHFSNIYGALMSMESSIKEEFLKFLGVEGHINYLDGIEIESNDDLYDYLIKLDIDSIEYYIDYIDDEVIDKNSEQAKVILMAYENKKNNKKIDNNYSDTNEGKILEFKKK